MPEHEPEETTQLLPLARAADPQTAPIPVFVDSTGRRRRMAQRVAAGAFLAAGGYSLMVIWSLLGGPVSPDTLMPFSLPHATPSVQPTTPSAGIISVPTVPSASNANRSTSSAPTGSASPSSAPTTSTSASASPSPSASASASGHRATGKPSKAATPGHG